MGRIMITFVLLLVTAVPFLRRYHAGEIGVRRGVQIFAVLLVAGALLMALSARATAEGMGFQALSRAMTTWAAGLQIEPPVLPAAGAARSPLVGGGRVDLPRAVGRQAGGLRRAVSRPTWRSARWRARR